MNWLKSNKDGITILLIFAIFIILELTGGLDFIFNNIIMPIFSGLHNSNPDYIPGESYPY